MARDNLVQEAQEILEQLGMDAERSNERSAMTFLALAHLDKNANWVDATNDMYRTRDLMDWMRDELGQNYAANTRETIRRFTLHQFVAGGIVEENADQPDRPINSPKWNYRLVPGLIPVLHAYGTTEYGSAIKHFLKGIETWREQQSEKRRMNLVPVAMPDGSTANLSAGGQNLLIKEMVEKFCPRYAPGGQVLYIDDTDHTHRTEQKLLMELLGFTIPERGKAPDLIVWMEDKKWLFLMEACSTHGPIDVIRKKELLDLFPGQKEKIRLFGGFCGRDSGIGPAQRAKTTIWN